MPRRRCRSAAASQLEISATRPSVDSLCCSFRRQYRRTGAIYFLFAFWFACSIARNRNGARRYARSPGLHGTLREALFPAAHVELPIRRGAETRLQVIVLRAGAKAPFVRADRVPVGFLRRTSGGTAHAQRAGRNDGNANDKSRHHGEPRVVGYPLYRPCLLLIQE